MAVKVMVAPAIARGEIAPLRPRRGGPGTSGEKKPRRRRSSVYDADGNEVFITLMCQKCHRMRPLSQFGLRRMADGAIRNQPWCRTCRSDASPKSRRETGASAEPPEIARPAEPGSSLAGPGSPVARAAHAPAADAAALALEVASALHRGRG